MGGGVLDPYALLGLNEHSANLHDARQSYYSLAMDTHPDRLRGNSEQFRVVHAAWKWVEEQLKNVPDASEVVARFESHRDEWEAFLKHQQTVPPEELPTMREVVPSSCGGGCLFANVAEVDWPAFPRGGYSHLTEAPAFVAVEPQQLIIYEEPSPLPDRFSCRLVDPNQDSGPLKDYSVLDVQPVGVDYRVAFSEPCTMAPDDRVRRVEEGWDPNKERANEIP